jgi:hypothetical protein
MKSALFTLGLIAFLLAQAPPNDNCGSALQLNIGSCRTGQTTQNATLQGGEPGGGCVFSGMGCNATQTVWYYFQAGANDSVLRITVDVTANTASCRGGLVVYGPFNNLPTCFTGFTQVWCQSTLDGGNLGSGGSNSAYYLDLPVRPNQYYMVQVWGRTSGGGGGGANDYINFDICLQRACNHCGNLCLTGVCNYGFNTPPSVTWVENNCTSISQNPPADHLSDLQHCFSFTAVNTTMYLGGVVSSNCSGGNVTSLTWTLYNNSCVHIRGPIDYFGPGGTTMTGLTVGQTYRVCYRYEVASNCAHSALYPFTYATPLPVTLVSYRATCAGGRVSIQWATAVEADLEAYLVERALPGRTDYEPVAYIKPQLTGGLKLYEVEDPLPALPSGTRYRLSELLPSGVAHPLATMELGDRCGEAYAHVIQAQGSLVLSVALPERGYCFYQLYTLSGQLLHQGSQDLPAGSHYIPLAENLTPGTYIVTYYLSDGLFHSQRISVSP